MHQNRKAILRNVAPNVVGLIDLERDGTVDWDMQGILAGISYLKFVSQMLIFILLNSDLLPTFDGTT